MSDLIDTSYESPYDKVISMSMIKDHKVVFREIYLDQNAIPSHICAYVRLIPPFRSSDDYEYLYETYREDDVFGVDTAHYHNKNQNMTQKLEDAKRQITELIQEHINWQAEQNITPEVPEPEPKSPIKQQPISVRRFLNLEL